MALIDAVQTVRINGVDHAYEIRGHGDPVVLLHGGWLRMEQWEPQVGALTREFRVLRYDARGYGRTPIGDAPYELHEDLAALMRALGIGPAHLVALSNGSSIAIDLALAHPELVRSLCIGAHPMRGVDMGQEFTDGMRAVVAAGVAHDAAVLRQRLWAFAPFRVAAALPEVRAALDRLIVEQNQWTPSRPGSPKRLVAEPLASERLADVVAPTLIVVGDGEMEAFLRQARHMAARIPGARLHVVAGGGHVVNLERPDDYTRVVLDWLRAN